MENAKGVVVQMQHSLFSGDLDLDVSAYRRKTLSVFECNARLTECRSSPICFHIHQMGALQPVLGAFDILSKPHLEAHLLKGDVRGEGVCTEPLRKHPLDIDREYLHVQLCVLVDPHVCPRLGCHNWHVQSKTTMK